MKNISEYECKEYNEFPVIRKKDIILPQDFLTRLISG